MIFATVGTQLPFDRLIRALDEWAGRHPQAHVFAQIGRSDYVPQHMEWERMITAESFRSYLLGCSTVVAHAGMGTIISAIEYGKRVVVLPRRAEFGEHRNDHQLATASRLAHLNGLEVVHDGEELALALGTDDAMLSESISESSAAFSVSPALISEIRVFAGLGAL